VRYLSPEGVPLATTNFNPADILRTATSAGIDLQELRGLGEKLNAAGVNYLPNQMYSGTGSNLGIDLADLASGGLGTAYDWREDPLAHLKGPFAVQQLLANRQLAEDLNLTPNTNLTSVANSLTPYTPGYSDQPAVFQLPYTAPTPAPTTAPTPAPTTAPTPAPTAAPTPAPLKYSEAINQAVAEGIPGARSMNAQELANALSIPVKNMSGATRSPTGSAAGGIIRKAKTQIQHKGMTPKLKKMLEGK
jgi:hypothetical protein